MIPVILYPSNLQIDYIFLSTEVKPEKANKSSILLERDTGKLFYFDGTEWVELPSSSISVSLTEPIDVEIDATARDQLIYIRRLLEEIILIMKSKN